MPKMETTGAQPRRVPVRRRILSTMGVVAIATAGGAWTGCGDDQADDAAQQINEAADQAQEQGQEAAEEATQEANEQLEEAEKQFEDQTGQGSGGTAYP
jgi:hypothetical protein